TGNAVDIVVEDGAVQLPYAPYESIMLMLFSHSIDVDTSNILQRKLEISTTGKWQLQCDRYNVVRLDTFDLSIGQEKQGQAVTTKVQVKTFIDQCQDIAQEQ